MTLKEKITKDVLDMPLVTSPNKKEISDYENGISRLEQIADNYAVEFANFIIKEKYNLDLCMFFIFYFFSLQI